MKLPDPTFPPLLTGHAVTAPQRPLEEACRGAAGGEYGAGDLVWARNLDRVQAALVLEPDVAPEQAREMLFVAMVAAGDSIGALAPPEVAITWDWPATLRANGAVIGGIDLVTAPQATEAGEPEWLVVGLDVALRNTSRDVEPGHDPDHTTLYDEGCAEIGRTLLVESWSRHLLSWIDTWRQEGFEPVHQAWMFRASQRNAAMRYQRDGATHEGTFIGLDDHGGLLLKGEAGTVLLEVRDTRAVP